MGRRRNDCFPQPKFHRKTGHARLRVNGKEYWLGRFGSREAEERYTEHLQAWVASGGKSADITPTDKPAASPPVSRQQLAAPLPTQRLTVGDLILRYVLELKKGKTDAQLKATSKWWLVRMVDSALRTRRTMPAKEFGPKALKAVRDELATTPRKAKIGGKRVMRTRWMVNRVTKETVRMFRWAVSEELIEPAQLTALQTVEILKEGDTPARESIGREPVGDEQIEQACQYLPPVVADLIRFVRLTGVRPSEACRLRMADVDTTVRPCWRWVLSKHKTKHLGKVWDHAIGPKAQAIVERWARGKPADKPVFAICDLERAKMPAMITKRMRRRPAEAFTVENIRHDIAAACRMAGIEAWTPYQLRHAALTHARQEGGLEAAQAQGGHASAKMSEHYARLAFETKSSVAAQIG